ncbi:hypothetical protein ABES02_27915, partial [Neobacillus pocheonensis]|uniref:hypothetical protein n=1 Tax=Neobacillus pocheonensis TaxID=363869 RepID=UPI003D27896E
MVKRSSLLPLEPSPWHFHQADCFLFLLVGSSFLCDLDAFDLDTLKNSINPALNMRVHTSAN